MTFEEWWAENGHKALGSEEVRFQKCWYEDAFEAGYEAGYKRGDYLEGFEEGYKAGQRQEYNP